MKATTLVDCDLEDMEDVLKIIEESYGLKFGDREFAHVNTYGELCDGIVNKIQLQSADDCTSQQAFYKLRDAIVAVRGVDKEGIKPDTSLESLFPIQGRRGQIKKLEQQLGFKLKVLSSKNYHFGIFFILFIGSFVEMYFNWKMGWGVLAFSILYIYAISKLGTELNVMTVGELADKMSRENYIKSRRNLATANYKEIRLKIDELFLKHLYFDEGIDGISPDAPIRENRISI
jgi:hypothetical protein